MAKYDKFNPRSRLPERRWTIHPIWRGIGCIMGILIPVMAYAGAVLLVEENAQQGWLPMPEELLQTVAIPGIGDIPNLYANLLVALVLSVLGFGLLIVFYSFVYRMTGPSQYGPMDAPPGDYRYRTGKHGSGRR